ncbi:UNVERIFIED_CONTAM: hypothetical protein GTU68_045379, partial [Idotea baltica]|nr:hypothetical protein [Idotea baltica]
QILSAGVYTNTNDDRFVVLHREGSDDWTLQIKYVQMADNGTYECQVHTGSGFLSQFINLHIVQPRAVIVGVRELHVSSGDTFKLTCIIEKVNNISFL